MREIRMQESTPSEMDHRPDGIWFRGVVRGDIRVYVIICLQTTVSYVSRDITVETRSSCELWIRRLAVVNPYMRVQAIPETHQEIFSNPRILLYWY